MQELGVGVNFMQNAVFVLNRKKSRKAADYRHLR